MTTTEKATKLGQAISLATGVMKIACHNPKCIRHCPVNLTTLNPLFTYQFGSDVASSLSRSGTSGLPLDESVFDSVMTFPAANCNVIIAIRRERGIAFATILLREKDGQ